MSKLSIIDNKSRLAIVNFSFKLVILTLFLLTVYISIRFGGDLELPANFLIIFSLLFLMLSFLSFKGAMIGFIFIIPFQNKGYPLEIGHLAITDIAIVVLFFLWIFRKAIKKKMLFPKEASWLLLFIMVILLSFLVNGDFASHMNYFFRVLSSILIFFILFDEIDSKEDYLELIKVLSITGIIVASHIVLEFCFLNARGLDFTRIFNLSMFERPEGLFYQPNKTAHFLDVIFPLCLFYSYKTKSLFFKFASIIIFAGIILTFSRGGIVILALALLLLPTKKHVKLAQILVMAIILVSLKGLFFEIRQESIDIRLEKYVTLIEFIGVSPLIGTGLHSYREISEELSQNNRNPAPHSLLVQLLVETGIMGFSFFLLFMYGIFKKIRGIKNDNRKYYYFYLSAFIALILTRLVTCELSGLILWVSLFVFSRVNLLFKDA